MNKQEIENSIQSIKSKLQSYRQLVVSIRSDSSKRRKIEGGLGDIERDVGLIETYGNQNGFTEVQLEDLTTIVSDDCFESKYISRIIRCLNPVNTVSSDSVLNLLGCINIFKQKDQINVLKWLTTSYIYFDTNAKLTLEKCYGILFSYLEYEYLSPYICMLLYYSTTAQKVTVYRVRYIYSLLQKVTTTGQGGICIYILLSLYVHFYNNVKLPSKPKSNKGMNIFIYGDKNWRERMSKINKSKPEQLEFTYITKRRGYLLPQISNNLNKELNIHTEQYNSSSSSSMKSKTIVTFTDIHSPSSFITSLFDKNVTLFLPSQGINIINNLYFCIYTSLFPTSGYIYRYNNVLRYILEDIYSRGDIKQAVYIMNYIYEYTLFTHEISDVIKEYMYKYCSTFTLDDLSPLLFSLLSYLPLLSFDELYQNILHPISTLFLSLPSSSSSSSSSPIYLYIHSITNLLYNYRTYIYQTIEANEEQLSLYTKTMNSLCKYLDQLFYQFFTLNNRDYLMYKEILVLSPYIHIISQLGHILIKYYQCISVYKTLHPSSSSLQFNNMNTYMSTYMNIYYKNKPLSTSNQKNRGNYALFDSNCPIIQSIISIAETKIPFTLYSIYSISTYYNQFQLSNEDTNDKTMKPSFLRYLSLHGYFGISEFKDFFSRKRDMNLS
ncbi:hypothetical protein WA158_000933 [Blastocystis sp. Blastoise]